MSAISSARPTGHTRTPSALRFGLEIESLGSPTVSMSWRLKRNCSLAPLQLLGFYLLCCLLSLGIAAGFWVQGATFVLPFAGIELLALGVALMMYALHACDSESIRLQGGRLTVEHFCGSRVDRVEFASQWVRVEPEHGDRSLIELSGQGQRISVGRFVRPELRRQLADEIRLALRQSHTVAPSLAI